MGAKARTQERKRVAEMRRKQERRRRIRVSVLAAVAVAAVVGGLYAVWQATSGEDGTSAAGQAGTRGSAQYPYQVGEPGAGDKAPEFSLPATTGKKISLADYRGKNVLLYFQEGLMCQPCFDQIGDLETNRAALEKAGVDEVLSVSIDPIDLTTRKMTDEGYTTPGVADQDKSVSRAYDALSYGMMGGSHPGHSFILIGPDGKIRWRADYGGEPKYTMFLPTSQIITDMRRDLKEPAK